MDIEKVLQDYEEWLKSEIEDAKQYSIMPYRMGLEQAYHILQIVKKNG